MSTHSLKITQKCRTWYFQFWNFLTIFCPCIKVARFAHNACWMRLILWFSGNLNFPALFSTFSFSCYATKPKPQSERRPARLTCFCFCLHPLKLSWALLKRTIWMHSCLKYWLVSNVLLPLLLTMTAISLEVTKKQQPQKTFENIHFMHSLYSFSVLPFHLMFLKFKRSISGLDLSFYAKMFLQRCTI